MQHKGSILEKAVRESGLPITRIAKKIGKTARWMYFLFNNPNAPLHYILSIGEIIHYDFSHEINELKKLSDHNKLEEQAVRLTTKQQSKPKTSGENYWKDKYLKLLEEYTRLLEKEKVKRMKT